MPIFGLGLVCFADRCLRATPSKPNISPSRPNPARPQPTDSIKAYYDGALQQLASQSAAASEPLCRRNAELEARVVALAGEVSALRAELRQRRGSTDSRSGTGEAQAGEEPRGRGSPPPLQRRQLSGSGARVALPQGAALTRGGSPPPPAMRVPACEGGGVPIGEAAATRAPLSPEPASGVERAPRAAPSLSRGDGARSPSVAQQPLTASAKPSLPPAAVGQEQGAASPAPAATSVPAMQALLHTAVLRAAPAAPTTPPGENGEEEQQGAPRAAPTLPRGHAPLPPLPPPAPRAQATGPVAPEPGQFELAPAPLQIGQPQQPAVTPQHAMAGGPANPTRSSDDSPFSDGFLSPLLPQVVRVLLHTPPADCAAAATERAAAVGGSYSSGLGAHADGVLPFGGLALEGQPPIAAERKLEAAGATSIAQQEHVQQDSQKLEQQESQHNDCIQPQQQQEEQQHQQSEQQQDEGQHQQETEQRQDEQKEESQKDQAALCEQEVAHALQAKPPQAAAQAHASERAGEAAGASGHGDPASGCGGTAQPSSGAGPARRQRSHSLAFELFGPVADAADRSPSSGLFCAAASTSTGSGDPGSGLLGGSGGGSGSGGGGGSGGSGSGSGGAGGSALARGITSATTSTEGAGDFSGGRRRSCSPVDGPEAPLLLALGGEGPTPATVVAVGLTPVECSAAGVVRAGSPTHSEPAPAASTPGSPSFAEGGVAGALRLAAALGWPMEDE